MATQKIHVVSIIGNIATITRPKSVTDQGKIRKNAITTEGCANCLKTVPYPGYQYGTFIYSNQTNAYCSHCGAIKSETALVEEVIEETQEEVVAVVERSQTSGCDPDNAGSNPVSHPNVISEVDLVAQLVGLV